MLLPLYTFAALANIIAKANNYDINVPYDPDFDIRVKRDVNSDEINNNDISRDVNVIYVRNIDNKEDSGFVRSYDENSEPVEVYFDEYEHKNDLNKEIGGHDVNKKIKPKGYYVYKDNDVVTSNKISTTNKLQRQNEINSDKTIPNQNNYEKIGIELLKNNQMVVKDNKRDKRSYYLPYATVKQNATEKQNETNILYYQLSDSLTQDYNVKNDNFSNGQGNSDIKNDTFSMKNHTKYEDSSTKNNTNVNNNLPVNQNPANPSIEPIDSYEIYNNDYDNEGYFVYNKPDKVDIYHPKPKVNQNPAEIPKNKQKGKIPSVSNNGTANKSPAVQSEGVNNSKLNETKSLEKTINQEDKEILQTQDVNNQKDRHYRFARSTDSAKVSDINLDYENNGDFIVFKRPILVVHKKQRKQTVRPKNYKNNNIPSSTTPNNPKNKQIYHNTNKPTPRPVRTTTKANKLDSSDESSGSSEGVDRTVISHKNNVKSTGRWHRVDRLKRSYYLPIPNDDVNMKNDGKTYHGGRKPNRGYYPLSDTHIPGYNDGYDASNFEGGEVRPYPKNKNASPTLPPKRNDDRNYEDQTNVHLNQKYPKNTRIHRVEKTQTQHEREENESNEGLFSSFWKPVKSFFSRLRRSIDEPDHDFPPQTAHIRKRKSVSEFFYNIIDKVESYTRGSQV
ncbi:putative uncharacterized protein DDB_G0293878 [Zerene cesonia]|uniref:putative uncharacterized protein DDB_G0293878 n=1 Tax=Zerene cesonia TaxID=33412 RepID=UPI0018E59493|nr:putative uncharacterized protein DDB_G0293878 [Zerene cesonia]